MARAGRDWPGPEFGCARSARSQVVARGMGAALARRMHEIFALAGWFLAFAVSGCASPLSPARHATAAPSAPLTRVGTELTRETLADASGADPKDLEERRDGDVFRAMQPQLLACYAKRLATYPRAHGYVTFDILVGDDGRPRDVATTGGALLGTEVLGCFTGHVRRAAFAPSAWRWDVACSGPVRVPSRRGPANELDRSGRAGGSEVRFSGTGEARAIRAHARDFGDADPRSAVVSLRRNLRAGSLVLRRTAAPPVADADCAGAVPPSRALRLEMHASGARAEEANFLKATAAEIEPTKRTVRGLVSKRRRRSRVDPVSPSISGEGPMPPPAGHNWPASWRRLRFATSRSRSSIPRRPAPASAHSCDRTVGEVHLDSASPTSSTVHGNIASRSIHDYSDAREGERLEEQRGGTY